MEEKKLTDEEEVQLAKEYREFADRSQRYSQNRYNTIADSLREIKLQIAAFVFAFSIPFITNLSNGLILNRIIFCISLLFLFLSVCLGLFGEYIKSQFWEEDVKRYINVWSMYDRVVRRLNTSLSEALHYDRGIFEGIKWKVSNQLPSILQTLFLLLGFGGILLVVLIYLFS